MWRGHESSWTGGRMKNSDKDENCQSFGARAMPLPVVGVSEMWCGCSVMRVGRWRPQAQLFGLKRWGVSSLSRRTIKYCPYCWAGFDRSLNYDQPVTVLILPIPRTSHLWARRTQQDMLKGKYFIYSLLTICLLTYFILFRPRHAQTLCHLASPLH